jgi:serine protease AprX
VNAIPRTTSPTEEARTPCPVCSRVRPLRALGADARGLQELLQQAFPELGDARERLCASCIEQLASARAALPEDLRDEGGKLLPILPLAVRLRATTELSGRGVTIAFLDSGFYPHPDLEKPRARIRHYEEVLRTSAGPHPARVDVSSWHGMMTTVVCAGSGHLSRGLYRGLAPEAELVLLKVGTARRIRPQGIEAGLRWVRANHARFGIRIVNISCGADQPIPWRRDPICLLVEELAREGVLVVCAAGNRGHETRHQVIAPASAPNALTVGGWNDGNRPGMGRARPYHSSYGPTLDGLAKPEIVAPAIWIAAPILPRTVSHELALFLEELDRLPDEKLAPTLRAARFPEPTLTAVESATPAVIRAAIASLQRERKLIGGHYQHVDGTSFAAPIVSALCAWVLEARPSASPREVKELLCASAQPLAGLAPERQGFGVVQPRRLLRALGRLEEVSPAISAPVPAT